MPKIVDIPAQRREILQAAKEVFARKGVEGTGMTHIADAAKMGRSSLYHYFKDKDNLVAALIQELMEQEVDQFRAALESGTESPLERIKELVGQQVDTFDEWCEMAGLTLDLWSRHQQKLRPFFRDLRTLLATLIEEGQEKGDIDRSLDADFTSASIIATIDGLLLQYVVDPDAFSDRELVRSALISAVTRQLQA
jgi:AcrR family transcriptional regulator